MKASALRAILPALAAILLCQCSAGKFEPVIEPDIVRDRNAARREVNALNPGEVFHYTAEDGATLAGRRYRPAGAVKRVVVAYHGFQSHSRWFGPVARHLNAAGVDLWCPDRRGSGLNTGGRFAAGEIDSWRTWQSDATAALRHVSRQTGRKDLDVLGYSLGGLLATVVLGADSTLPVSRAVLIAPGYAENPVNLSRGKKAALLAAAAISPAKRVWLPTPAESAKPHGALILAEDESMMRNVTLGLLREIHSMQKAVPSNLAALRLPVTVRLAGRDEIVHNPEIVSILEKHASPSVKLLPNMETWTHFCPVEDAASFAAETLRALRR